MIFRGVATALATPFKKDLTIDYEAYDKLLAYQVENKVDGLVVCGTTAEAATMDKKEKLDLINFTIEKVGGRLPIIVGTGSNNTKEAAEFSKEVSEIDGVDALLVVTPYYNKANREGLYKHFKTIAEESTKPIILYNVPSRTGVNIDPELVGELSKIKNIVGIKDATGDLHYTIKVKSLVDEDFAIYSGNDDLIVPLMSVGGCGVISVLSNILPKETSEMVHDYLEGREKDAGFSQVKYINLIEALFNEVNPVPVKEAMRLLGISDNYMRLPLSPASNETAELLEDELKKLGVL
ncbi:4-hydroxy-tetrahydrodipicolinate synthase [Anaerococcus sp.]|uniref:4-hydroxy-tetrahydrodipicolinate synthase n=1 Tax=Anaerococcus sp. TaxID=1872515 RepID=UPI002A756578|nr:4-hydroxy-tetrahydrodipicolinate synthase [Anaerococcus sp.]MDY2927233.1 4-hydroxy-tetrahydrodipicolinate synthase [Anaerococcus sp.]